MEMFHRARRWCHGSFNLSSRALGRSHLGPYPRHSTGPLIRVLRSSVYSRLCVNWYCLPLPDAGRGGEEEGRRYREPLRPLREESASPVIFLFEFLIRLNYCHAASIEERVGILCVVSSNTGQTSDPLAYAFPWAIFALIAPSSMNARLVVCSSLRRGRNRAKWSVGPFVHSFISGNSCRYTFMKRRMSARYQVHNVVYAILRLLWL